MKSILTIMFTIIIFLTTFQGKAARMPAWQQCGTGNSASNPCPVSVYTLLSNPEHYDEIYVTFIGFYPASGAAVVYANEDSAIQADFMSSILLESKQENNCGYYEIRGRFRYDTHDSGLASGIYKQSGRLYGIKMSRPPHGFKRGCSPDWSGIEYLNGVVPIRRVK